MWCSSSPRAQSAGRQAMCESHSPYRRLITTPHLVALTGGERLRSFTIVATLPNEPSAEPRDRMSGVLKPEDDQAGSARSPRTRAAQSFRLRR
jgi:putative SOS response-associated peptidase YedK